jgi:sulfate adenylyltransferase
MTSTILQVNQRQYLELRNIGIGSFAPLNGFMDEVEFSSVVESMRLPDGQVFPLPVTLDIAADQAKRLGKAEMVTLVFQGQEVGTLTPTSVYKCDKAVVAAQVFGTDDVAHPGVNHLMRMGDYFLGGPVKLLEYAVMEFSQYDLTPAQTRALFRKNGWDTVVGFQTRNVPHRAHEYLLRLALEQADGLFIQPLVGIKKRGDYTARAILEGYEELIDGFLPKKRIQLGVLSATMRYAGPREAVFHAIIRRNYGCTHFIVGRDHAGVGDYYGKYEAHEMTRKFYGDLGIDILRFAGPFHCSTCGGIVTERTCPHDPDSTEQISGTDVRSMLSGDKPVPADFMRPEVVQRLRGMPVFIDQEAE